jgi:hypothetical protein
MSLGRIAVRIQGGRELGAPGIDRMTQLLLGATQVVLATVFIPIVFLILVVVGISMIAEWIVLRVDAAIGLDDRRLARPNWERFPLPVDDPIKG